MSRTVSAAPLPCGSRIVNGSCYSNRSSASLEIQQRDIECSYECWPKSNMSLIWLFAGRRSTGDADMRSSDERAPLSVSTVFTFCPGISTDSLQQSAPFLMKAYLNIGTHCLFAARIVLHSHFKCHGRGVARLLLPHPPSSTSNATATPATSIARTEIIQALSSLISLYTSYRMQSANHVKLIAANAVSTIPARTKTTADTLTSVPSNSVLMPIPTPKQYPAVRIRDRKVRSRANKSRRAVPVIGTEGSITSGRMRAPRRPSLEWSARAAPDRTRQARSGRSVEATACGNNVGPRRLVSDPPAL